MPAHIYLRLGRYKDVLEVNKDAAASDERHLAANPGVQGPYPAMYYPHNVHFEMTAALMAGQGEPALKSADKLARLIPDEAALAIPGAQPIKQAPYFIHAQFSDPQTILALPSPSEKLPLVAASWRYARGIAFSLMGKAEEADQKAGVIRDILSGNLSPLDQANVPARGILEIAENQWRDRSRATTVRLRSRSSSPRRTLPQLSGRASWRNEGNPGYTLSASARSPASGESFWRKNFR
jgi:hypothetical protein